MISRECQKYLLSLLKNFGVAEIRLEMVQNDLWTYFQHKPSRYIDIYMAVASPFDADQAWNISQSEFKGMLDDLEVDYMYEELLPLVKMMSSTRQAKISFRDFMYFVFCKKNYQSVEEFDLMSRYLSENFSAILDQIETKKARQRDKATTEPSHTEDISVGDLLGASKVNPTRQTARLWDKPTVISLPSEVQQILRRLVETELANLRELRIACELIVHDTTFNAKLLFALLDNSGKGYFSTRELRQFSIKLGQQMPEETIRYVFQRLRLSADSDITRQDFMHYFFEIFVREKSSLQTVYNIYFKTPAQQTGARDGGVRMDTTGGMRRSRGDRWTSRGGLGERSANSSPRGVRISSAGGFGVTNTGQSWARAADVQYGEANRIRRYGTRSMDQRNSGHGTEQQRGPSRQREALVQRPLPAKCYDPMNEVQQVSGLQGVYRSKKSSSNNSTNVRTFLARQKLKAGSLFSTKSKESQNHAEYRLKFICLLHTMATWETHIFQLRLKSSENRDNRMFVCHFLSQLFGREEYLTFVGFHKKLQKVLEINLDLLSVKIIIRRFQVQVVLSDFRPTIIYD